MIVIRTKHDKATAYLFAWTEPLLKEAEKRGFKVISIDGQEANFNNFEKRIIRIKPRFIFFNGHGTKNSFYDNNQKELVNLDSCYLLKRTVTFARACDCLTELGKTAVKNGCLSFIGYKKKFFVPHSPWTECKPLNDWVAKPVMECSNSIVYELLKGKTVKEAVAKSHERAAELIVELIYSKEYYSSPTLAALIHNDAALDFEGSHSVSIIA